MFTWKEGQEFSLGDVAGWNALQLAAGMIIEVLLHAEAAGGREDLWAGLLVTDVHLGGDRDSYLNVYVKSLGCSDPDVAKQLSSWFNRRSGYVHLCQHALCLEESECNVHVTRLKVFSPEGFQREYMTNSGQRQLKKWLEDLGLDDPENRPYAHPGPPDPVPGGAPEAEEAGEEPADVEWADLGAGVPPLDGPKAKDAREEISPSEKHRLRERLANAREHMAGRAEVRGAGKKAVRQHDSGEAIEISSSEGYSASVGHKERDVKKEDAPRKKKPRPLDPHGPRRALALVGPELGRGPRDVEGAQKEKKKKKAPKVLPLKNSGELEEATNVTTTGSLQKQLMARAAEAAQDRKDRKKEKKTSKDPGKQLAQILTKVVSSKKKQKDKKKRKRRKRKQAGDPPGGSSSDGSDSSQTSNSEGDSDGAWEEDESTSSDDARMEPPLKKKAIQHPGSVLRMLVDHAREKLDQTSKVSVSRRDEGDPTQGIRITSYFQIVVKAQLAQNSPQLRELHLLSHAVDLLRAGELDSVGDLLASRFISLHQAALDGHWGAARHLEMLPYEETTAAGAAVVLKARKHAKLSAQVAGTEPGNWKGGGKGRGKFQRQWDDQPWQPDAKGRGKKGGKGRGQPKGAWKGQPAIETGETRAKEKVPEK
eukprot:s562_g9.t1